jgi:glycosyltransferase involved in cell wall biosynthesis
LVSRLKVVEKGDASEGKHQSKDLHRMQTKERYDIVFIPLGAASMGGAERSIAYLARGMQDQGKKVAIFAEHALQRSYYPRFLETLRLPVRWIDWAPEHSLVRNVIDAARVFRSIDADVIQFNISWRRGMWVVPIVARICSSSKLIGTMRGMPDPHQSVKRQRHFGIIPGLQLWHLPEIVAGRIWARVLHLTVSVNALDYPRRLVDDYGYSVGRIRVVHNGIHFREHPLDDVTRQRIRQSVGVQDSDVLLGYFGRLTRQKGVDLLIEALARLPARYKLIIAGDGPSEPALRQLALERVHPERIRFLGFLDQPDDSMAACDVIAVPSTWQEACSRVVIEALNQGTPVIGTRVGGTPELVEDGIEGKIISAGSVDELADAARLIGESDATRLRFSAAARQRASSQFRLERVTERYAELYSELVGASHG